MPDLSCFKMNVFIVGGGPAGLLAAAKLSETGFNVTVIEEHRKLGFPEHCTGIVRDDFIRIIGYHDLQSIVLAKYTGGYVSLELGGTKYHVDTKNVKAIMIDRPLYERVLGEYAVASGAKLILGRPASIIKKNGEYCVKTDSSVIKPDLVIGARGPRANPNLNVITGLQAYVRSVPKLQENELYVTLSSSFPDFFGWVAPYNDGRVAKVGIASSNRNLRRLLDMVGQNFIGSSYIVQSYFGGLVVIGFRSPIQRFGVSSYIPVGDEAGLVKPLTGGGLDLGVFGVYRLTEDLRRGDFSLLGYRKWLYKTRLRLFWSQMARRLFFTSRKINVDLLTKIFEQEELATILQKADFDDHVGVLLKAVPLFVQRYFEGFL